MLNKIKTTYYAIISIIVLLFNASIVASPIITLSLLKLIIPIKSVRYVLTTMLEFVARVWVAMNIFATKSLSPTNISIDMPTDINKDGSYLIISNHRSWLDTLIVQLTFHNKVAFPKFFMKFQMFFVPLVGLICWALEFPAMRRYKKHYIEKHPEKKGEDIRRTKEYCSKLPVRPTTIVNFVEGTRRTEQKAKKSNFANLLNPKAGGIAVILESLDRIDGILNTTIVYETDDESLWRFMCRETKNIKVKVDFIPKGEIPLGDYFNNDTDKQIFQNWLNNLWQENDNYIEKTQQQIAI